MSKITKEWLEGEVTISREELGEIIAKETYKVAKTARAIGDQRLSGLLCELLMEFGACVATEIFKKLETEKEDTEF